MEIIYTPTAEDDIALLQHRDERTRRQLRPPRGSGLILGLILGLGFASVLAVDVFILQDGRLSLVMGLGALALLGILVVQWRARRQFEVQMAQQRANSEHQIRAAYAQQKLVRRSCITIEPSGVFVQALEPAGERQRFVLKTVDLTADYLFLFEQGPSYLSLPRSAIPDLERCLQLLTMISSQNVRPNV